MTRPGRPPRPGSARHRTPPAFAPVPASWHALGMLKISDDFAFRGLVQQVSDEGLWTLLDEGATTAYVGFDPTSDSLHVGNLLGIVTLRRLQEAGHRPILLAGGGTGLIGDPGGKSDERPLLSTEQLVANLEGIRAQFGRPARSVAGGRGCPGPAARQLRMAVRLWLHRLPPRRRQALHRQPDDGQGVREGPLREAGPGHLLYRVQLHVASGLRLPLLARRLRLPSPARGQRPVGEHHDGARAHPQGARFRGLCSDLATAAACRRDEVRQERVRGGVARCGQVVALRAVPVLRADPRRRGGPLAALFHVLVP